MSADTHLELIADLAERPLSQIQELNPAVLRLTAPAGYEIHVPKGMGKTTLSRLEFVPGGKRTAWRVRRLQPGDSVSAVAALYRVTEQAVANANRQPVGGDSTAEWSPEPGDFVVVPASYAGPGLEQQGTGRGGKAGVSFGPEGRAHSGGGWAQECQGGGRWLSTQAALLKLTAG
jgi:hypothetical protein